MAIMSRAVCSSTYSRSSRTSAIPSLNDVWMWRSALPISALPGHHFRLLFSDLRLLTSALFDFVPDPFDHCPLPRVRPQPPLQALDILSRASDNIRLGVPRSFQLQRLFDPALDSVLPSARGKAGNYGRARPDRDFDRPCRHQRALAEERQRFLRPFNVAVSHQRDYAAALQRLEDALHVPTVHRPELMPLARPVLVHQLRHSRVHRLREREDVNAEMRERLHGELWVSIVRAQGDHAFPLGDRRPEVLVQAVEDEPLREECPK